MLFGSPLKAVPTTARFRHHFNRRCPLFATEIGRLLLPAEAFEARAKAVHMETEERRRIMLRIADEYYLLAIRAEERIQRNELMAA